jgi:hypothetical protein
MTDREARLLVLWACVMPWISAAVVFGIMYLLYGGGR